MEGRKDPKCLNCSMESLREQAQSPFPCSAWDDAAGLSMGAWAGRLPQASGAGCSQQCGHLQANQHETD